MTTPPEPRHGPDTSEDVADLLEVLASANGWLRSELAALAGSTAAVSQVTLGRLESLAAQLRPVAKVRVELASIDHQLLLAGTTVWARRQGRQSATVRAAARWQRRS